MRKLLLAFVPLLWVCLGHLTSNAQQRKTEKLENLSYGPFERNVMDVYLPANRTDKTPFVVLIHGGAWTLAGKENIRDLQDSLFSHGIAIASINHRYANNTDVHYPQMLADVDRAVNFCLAHGKQWGIKNNLVMAGVSSGAHLALMYSYTIAKKVNAIVEFVGPTDLADTAILNYSTKVGLIDVIQKMTGKMYHPGEALPSEYQASSPVYHVKNIPILIVHGTADPVVNFSQSQRLNQKLNEEKVVHKLVVVPGAGHDLNLDTNHATKLMVYKEAEDWILKYGYK